MTIPAQRPFAALRDDIWVEHERIRHLLDELNDEAAEVVRDEPKAACDLGRTLASVLRALAEHMDLEERGISCDPLVAAAWGPAGLAHLEEDHARQREGLARLGREAAASDDRISLSFAIRGFVSDVLLDMAREEARLSSSSAGG